MFYHRDCGGILSVDITNIISWKSPSLSIQPEGIKVGITEINVASDVDSSKATFHCEKCEERFLPLDHLEDFADMDCPVCGDKTPVFELMNSRSGLNLCTTCLKIARGEKVTKKERILKTIRYFSLEGSRMVFRPLSEVLVKKIIF